ncbi:hypothetical protein Daus18300_011862 [Diaporthe australafricana]|uniref:Uncharacterized protein n=1 Tax=Diaporthe australafricana TaxID=127596 RepID=A0ABR3W4Z4_9PEZI
MLILLIFALVTLPFLALLALLRPSEPTHHSLSKRNPCDGIGFPQIELYKDYTEPMCPAPNHLDDQGNCEDFDNTKQDCASFCQLTTTYVWARESPFFGSECHYPMRCKLRVTDSTKWSLDGFVAADAQFEKALGVGITGGLGSSWGHINGHLWSITPQPGECGYFTWVPVTKRTWTSVTTKSGILRGGLMAS